MVKRFMMLMLMFLVCAAGAEAKEVGGVDLPDSLAAYDNELLLNGGGVREKFFLDLYACGLYLTNKCADPQQILDADKPMAVRLHIISELITPEKMEDTTREGFERSTNGNIAPVKAQIETFLSVFKNGITPDDTYDLIYVPGKGVESYKNSEYIITTEGMAFKKALFGIWISERPVQKNLKKAMLGK